MWGIPRRQKPDGARVTRVDASVTEKFHATHDYSEDKNKSGGTPKSRLGQNWLGRKEFTHSQQVPGGWFPTPKPTPYTPVPWAPSSWILQRKGTPWYRLGRGSWKWQREADLSIMFLFRCSPGFSVRLSFMYIFERFLYIFWIKITWSCTNVTFHSVFSSKLRRTCLIS